MLISPLSDLTRLVTLAVLLLVSVPVHSQSNSGLLFDTHEVLELSLDIDFDELCQPHLDPDCDYVTTQFRYNAPDGEITIPVEIRRRGGWRAMRTNCRIPTLFVRFNPDDTYATPFQGQTVLALTSHCGKGRTPTRTQSRPLPNQFERYVVNEYLGYRLYNLMTEESLRVRLARIRYEDPDEPAQSVSRDAFFSEHFNDLAGRLGAQLVAADQLDTDRLDLASLDRMSLFQYMIGNTDWSVEDLNNVILLEFEDGRQVPVLYDLDMSGLVNAHYAFPAPDVPIRSVTERYYLGYCHDATNWDSHFDQYLEKETEIMGLLADTPGLGRGDRRMTGVFLDGFFDTLNSPSARQREIVDHCRSWSENSVTEKPFVG